MMDMLHLKLNTGFMKGIVANIITKAIRNKLDCEIEIAINEIEIAMENGKAHVHLSMDASTDGKEVTRLIKNFGLG